MRVCSVCGNPLPPRKKKYCSTECAKTARRARYKNYYKEYSRNRRITRQLLIWDIFINGGEYYDDSDNKTIQGCNP